MILLEFGINNVVIPSRTPLVTPSMMACVYTQRQSHDDDEDDIHMSQYASSSSSSNTENVQSRGNEPSRRSRNLLCLFSCSYTPPQPRLSRSEIQHGAATANSKTARPRVCRNFAQLQNLHQPTIPATTFFTSQMACILAAAKR